MGIHRCLVDILETIFSNAMVHIMACVQQTTHYYLNQYGPGLLTHTCSTWPRCVKANNEDKIQNSISDPLRRIHSHKWSDSNMVKRSVSWLYLIRVKCIWCVKRRCRVVSHLNPRECTSLRFNLSTDNSIHEMYFEISSYEYGHAPIVLHRTKGPGNPDKTACLVPVTTS